MLSRICAHNQFTIEASVTKHIQLVTSNESDHFALVAQVKCTDCGMPFEFVGLPRVGVPDPQVAAVNPTGLMVQVPIRPGFTKMFVPALGETLNVGLPPKVLK
jgi:hypothetical protein